MSELTRDHFDASMKEREDSADRRSRDQIHAMEKLGDRFGEAIKGLGAMPVQEKKNGNALAISLFSMSVILTASVFTVMQSAHSSTDSIIVREREDRIAADVSNNDQSIARHNKADKTSEARHSTISNLVQQNKTEVISQLQRLESYHDEIVLAVMRRLGGGDGYPKSKMPKK